MTTYSVATAKSATLGVATADTVNLAADNNIVAVTNRGSTDPIYFRLDGVAATVAGVDNYVVLAGHCKSVDYAGGKVSSVSLIAASAVAYTVEAA